MIESGAGIHQILVAASPGDAITNMAFGFAAMLRRGWSVGDLRAAHRAAAARRCHRTAPTTAPPRAQRARVPRVDRPARGARVPRRRGANRSCSCTTTSRPRNTSRRTTRCSRSCSRSAATSSSACARVSSLAIADSAYNAASCEAMGYRDVRVVPPLSSTPPAAPSRRPTRVDRASPRRVSTRRSCCRSGSSCRTSGPISWSRRCTSPTTYLGMRNFLLLVGHHRLPRYTRAVREQVRELKVLGVHVVGPVDEPELAAIFRSGHGGRDRERARRVLPAARRGDDASASRCGRAACAAVPETVGDAATARPATSSGPALYAEAVAELVSNASLQRSARGPRPRERVEELDAAAAEAPCSSMPCSRSSDAAALRGAALRRDDRGRRRAALPRDGRAHGAARPPRRGRDDVRASRTSTGPTCTSRGISDVNGVAVHRFRGAAAARQRPVQRSEPAHERGRGARPLGGATRVDAHAGPVHARADALARAQRAVASTASSSSRTSTGRRGPALDGDAPACVPTVLHPTVHDEPPLRLSLFDAVFRAPDAFASSTPEEIELIRRRFRLEPKGEVVGIGVDLVGAIPTRSAPRIPMDRRAVPAVRRAHRPGKGARRAGRVLRRVQGAAIPRRSAARDARRPADRNPGARRHRRHRLRRLRTARLRARGCARPRAAVVLRELLDGAHRGVRASAAGAGAGPL